MRCCLNAPNKVVHEGGRRVRFPAGEARTKVVMGMTTASEKRLALTPEGRKILAKRYESQRGFVRLAELKRRAAK